MVAMLDADEVIRRVTRLKALNQEAQPDRGRIRDIMNGGLAGMRALLGDKAKLFGKDIPAPNLVMSGLNRLAQKIGRTPTIKILPPPSVHQESANTRAGKRERIVGLYDRLGRLHMQLPQVGRWVPGYGYAGWVVVERISEGGHPYPVAELRDPYTTFPGTWGPDQQPSEVAFSFLTTYAALEAAYGTVPAVRKARSEYTSLGMLASSTAGAGGSWSSQSSEMEVAEYHDITGSYVVLPEAGVMLDSAPNSHLSRPRFVLCKRFSFDKLIGQYDHIFGLFSMLIKLNSLLMISSEENVFTETVIIGDIDSGKYKKGRGAVNILSPGSEIVKPVNMASPEVGRNVDRAERQLRVTAGYPVTDDAESPSAWITGKGTQEITSAIGLEIREYQTCIADALALLDSLRLEWDDRLYGGRRKPLKGYGPDGVPYSETYDPASDIKGDYDTQRVYGLMAAWDDDRKIIGGLQLKDAGIIDDLTMQENLDGLTDVAAIRERISRQKALDLFYQGLAQAQAQGDPKATMALVQIIKNPSRLVEILEKFYTPEGEQMSEEEEALAAPQPLAGQLMPGAPPDVQSVLAQMSTGSTPSMGVQTRR